MSFYNRALKLNQFSRFLHTVPSNLPASSSRSTSGILASRLREPLGVIPQQRRLALCSTIGSNGCVFHYGQRCSYSTEAPDELPPRGRGRTLPKLMDFPEIIWPSIMKSIKNWIMVHFIIRPYFDREFSLPEFVQGAKQALQVVSASLAGGELKSLDGLVDRQTLNDLKNTIGKMSVAQRYDLMVQKEDIYFSFPYQVGVMFDEEDEASQKRFVEITMVFHVLKGLKGMVERGETIPLNVGVMPEYRDKISICNYRFIKEFTKGVDSDWTVNVVSHFKPSDLIDE
ncbi:AAEL007196-PA [Aedes aegypti]|uniref:Juvenile hormone esterase-binding protein n=2 Tax=Aedes aegypti TaxID=7159 RepID=Q1HQU1_AEDAE|nr:m-AAA protease-interacting protein 1, mitochondrial [Aedes aegypti]ABF18386.1 juvenile hormone esterase-binding protein [Aedes aegypti]EAT41135.1 AAEL007196-PA [Aedes aegypti]